MSGFSDFIERLRLLLFRRREERELAEELHFHVDMEADQNRRLGLDETEARRRGRIALGGVEQVKEEVRDARGTRLLEETVGDVAHTIRGLVRSPGFSIVVVLTLAIGIGGTTAVFSAVDAVLLQPLPYQQPGQLVRLYQYYAGKTDDVGFVTPVHYLAYRGRMASFESTAAMFTYHQSGADIGGSERPERIQLLPVSPEYFGVVRVQPRLGRGFQAQEENGARVVVLSDELWQREFQGDRSAVGRNLTMSGVPYTVVGVMPPGFTDPIAGRIDAWVPEDLSEGRDPSNSGNHYLTVIARLRPLTPVARAQAELDALGVALARDYPNNNEIRARLAPLKEDIVGPASRSLEIMLGAVALVLLLVCVNIANLLLVRGSERAREFALRSALGAPRTRLVRQLLIESVILALAGAGAGLVLARGIMSAIVALGSGSIPRLTTLSLEPRLLAFSVAVASLSALVFGLAPALRSTRTEPGDVLRDQSRSATGSGSQSRLRSGLVVSQVALAFVLLAGAGVLIASFERLRRMDLGVETDGVLTFELQLPAARYDSIMRARFYQELAVQVERIPGVRAAGGISKLPATGTYNVWSAEAMTGPLAGAKGARVVAEQRVVSGDYFRTLGIPLLGGRAFDARDVAGAQPRVIISKRLAELIFPDVDPIGQRVRAGNRVSEVVGVVPDVALDVEGRRALPYVYHPHAQFAGDRNWELSQVVSATVPFEQLEPVVRRTLAVLDPELVMYRPTTLAETIGRGTAGRLFTVRILTSFALVALALAALGLFGVLSYAVRLRAREFGIRMALGADRRAIRGMVLRQGLTVTAVGVGIGLLGAAALSKLMAAVVFQVSPLDPLVLAGAVVFMGSVAVIAAYLPAYRATAVDPRVVLQGE
ncbi:MAG: ABC transporter permease [Gemmatimonadota bacterium]